MNIEIETKSLFIRPYKSEDFESCLKLYGDEKLTKYFDHGEPRSRKEVEDLIEEKTHFFSNSEPFGLFSIFRKEDMAFIGQFDLIPFDEAGVVEIGCILERKYHNQGFSQEILKFFLMDYIRDLIANGAKSNGARIFKTIATVHPMNLPSKKLIQKVGMKLEKSEERFGHPRLWFSFYYEGDSRNAHMEC